MEMNTHACLELLRTQEIGRLAVSITDYPDTFPINCNAEHVLLPGGLRVDFLRIQSSDEDRLQDFHHRLSPDTIRRRFFYVHPELSPAELRRFTHVDHVNREAIVAVADGEIVAVARFDRIDSGLDAEVAFVVADSWQGRGLGTALLSRLAARARHVGIARFTAATLPDNAPMLSVFHHAGLPITERYDEGIVELTLDLALRP